MSISNRAGTEPIANTHKLLRVERVGRCRDIRRTAARLEIGIPLLPVLESKRLYESARLLEGEKVPPRTAPIGAQPVAEALELALVDTFWVSGNIARLLATCGVSIPLTNVPESKRLYEGAGFFKGSP